MTVQISTAASEGTTWLGVSYNTGISVSGTYEKIALNYVRLDPQRAREVKPELSVLFLCKLKPDTSSSAPLLAAGNHLNTEVLGIWIYNSRTGDVYRKFTLNEPSTSSKQGSNRKLSPRVSSGISLAAFNRISEGMTYSQVVDILGKGTEISRSSIAAYTTVMYQWQAEGLGNMNAMFQNGKLISKAQFGLK